MGPPALTILAPLPVADQPGSEPPGDREVIFASTHGAGPGCLTPPDRSMGYVWKIYPEFDLWVRNLETGAMRTLSPAPGYDAEATISPDGKRIVFTSRRNGDLDVYTMGMDGSMVRQLTHTLGSRRGVLDDDRRGSCLSRSGV